MLMANAAAEAVYDRPKVVRLAKSWAVIDQTCPKSKSVTVKNPSPM